MPGAYRYQNSHRSELAGIVASLTILIAICRTYSVEFGKAVICLDGKQAIDNIKQNYINPDCADFDMLMQVKVLINELPIYIEFEWVKSHQDDDIPFHQLSYQAQLNVIADNKAKEYLKKIFLTSRPDPALIFPGEKWSICRNGEKFSSVDLHVLYDLLTADALKQFWGQKGNIEVSLLKELDWDNFGKFFGNCTFAKQRRVIKLASRHAPVAKMMLRWKKQDHSRCPLCGDENKDVHHIITCRSVAACKAWRDETQTLQDTLESIDTFPAITNEIVRQVQHWHSFPMQQPLEPHTDDDWELQRCISHQNRIGWENFLKGRILVLWARCQQHYFDRIQSPRSGHTWARKMIKATWTLIWRLWDCCNFGKHHTLTPAFKEELLLIDAQIREQYDQGFADLLTSDHMLIEDPLEDILDHDIKFKRKWLASLSAAQAKFHHKQNETYASLASSRNNMTRWLCRSN